MSLIAALPMLLSGQHSGHSPSPSARSVKFTWTGQAKSVVVVGTFNQWDRAANPLKRSKNGTSWEATFKIPVGAHRYKFCLDNSRWVTDPARPEIPDSNGNVNSLLVIAPASYDAKPGARGDGQITRSALRHDPTSAMRVPVNESEAWVEVEVRAGDVQKVSAFTRGARFPLQPVRSDPLVEIWGGRIPIQKGQPYAFVIEDGPGAITRSPEFVFNTRPGPLPQAPAKFAGKVFYQIFPDRFLDGDPTNNPAGTVPWGSQPTPKSIHGGDLLGIEQKLAYLRSLGVRGLYLNPTFPSASNHGYDIDDYTTVAPRLGTERDMKRLVAQCHANGIAVMLDGVFNHSSPNFFAFKEMAALGKATSKSRWFFPLRFPVEVTEGQQTYRTFAGVPSMPKLNQDHPETSAYFRNVAIDWMTKFGIDAWRLDVADEVSPAFWRQFRTSIKAARPSALIVGEVWGPAAAWLKGDQFDSVMNYRFRTAVLDFLATGRAGAKPTQRTLQQIIDNYPDGTLHGMYNLLGSHDTERLMTVCQEKPEVALCAMALLLTYPGIPSVYYGDEIGLTGGKEPASRNPMPWGSELFQSDYAHKVRRLMQLRNQIPELQTGALRWGKTDGTALCFFRVDPVTKRQTSVVINGKQAARIATPPGELLHSSGIPTRERSMELVLPPFCFAIFRVPPKSKS